MNADFVELFEIKLNVFNNITLAYDCIMVSKNLHELLYLSTAFI